MEPRRFALRVYTLSRMEKMMSKPVCAALCLALWMAMAACAAAGERTRAGIAPPTRIPDVVANSGPAGEPVPSAAVPRAVRRAVVADAARRFKVAESAVVLARAEQLTWSDGSLGCPEPGQMYTQMLVPGFRVVAKTDEGALLYHTDSRGHAVACGVDPVTPAQRMSDKMIKPVEPRTQPPAGKQPDR
jgi:hypothetical protein